jgi:GntR family transcriptional regulator/MocR family aminotransferase
MAHVYKKYELSFLKNTPNKANEIVEGISKAIKNRILSPNWQLLPSTELAEELGVSRNTVLKAYHILKSQGWVGKMDKSGTFVAKKLPILSENPDPRFGDQLLNLKPTFFEQAAEWMNTTKYFTIGHPVDPPYWLSDASAGTNNLFANLPRRTKSQWSSFIESNQLIKTAQANLAYKRNASIATSQIAIANDGYVALHSIFKMLRTHGAKKVIMRRSAHWLIYSICKENGLDVLFVDLPKEGFTVELIRNLKQKKGIALSGYIIYTAPSIEYPFGYTEIDENRNKLVDYLAQNRVFIVENYKGDSQLSFLGRDNKKYNNIISITSFANTSLIFKSINIVVAPTEFIQRFKKLIGIKYERTCFLVEQMAVWFHDEGSLYEGFAINQRRYRLNRSEIVNLVDDYLGGRFEVVENWGGNSMWLKATSKKGYTVDWVSCPPDLKENIHLNIGYSAGSIPDKAFFSKMLIYLNLIDLKKLEEFFGWMVA